MTCFHTQSTEKSVENRDKKSDKLAYFLDPELQRIVDHAVEKLRQMPEWWKVLYRRENPSTNI